MNKIKALIYNYRFWRDSDSIDYYLSLDDLRASMDYNKSIDRLIRRILLIDTLWE